MQIYNTKVSQFRGDLTGPFTITAYEQMSYVSKALADSGSDALKIVTDAGHAAGMDVWASMRMNDTHEITPYKKAHPELLLGTIEDHSGYDFAHAKVRENMIRVIVEVFNGYDVDGLEMDFLRMPKFFVDAEAYAHRHVMTQFVGQVRKLTRDAEGRRGGPFHLAARVPESVHQCMHLGLDIRTWLETGLLDLVVLGGGYCPFESDFQEISDLAKGFGVPTYACFNAPVLLPSYDVFHNAPAQAPAWPRRARAAALRALNSGVQGVYLFNLFGLHHSRGLSREESNQCLDELGDPAHLQTLDRIYVVGPTRPGGGLSLYDPAIPAGQAPLTVFLATDGIGQAVRFDIREDLKAIRPAPRQVCLRVRLRERATDDEITFSWNEHVIQPHRINRMGVLDSWEDFEFDLSPDQVVLGPNRLGIRLDRRNERMVSFVTMEEADLAISV